ncbi:DUF3307 domain-containing protein [Patescibacteria group bacterium]|nr:DUF3307 domain-containing protein [Patescibacteria group bacterium]
MIAKLLLAHLIADFLLQPNELIALKMRNSWGVFIHTIIVFMVGALILFPYLTHIHVWLVILGISIIHYWQDKSKVLHERHAKKHFAWYFLLDQAFHITIIIVGGYLLSDWINESLLPEIWFFEKIYTNNPLIIMCSILIITVQAWDILQFQFTREKEAVAIYKRDYLKLGARGLVLGVIMTIIYWLFFI